jgi:TolB protein
MKFHRPILFFLLFCLLPLPACTPPPPTVKDYPGQFTYVADLNGTYKIMVMDKDGKPVQITHDTTAELQPSWSPDGKMVAFETSRHIFKMNADGTNVIQLTTQADYDSYPAWSPDGTKIAFVSNLESKTQIYLMNPDGSDQTKLTQGANPSWSPDSQQIAFDCPTSTVGVANICVINRDGTHLRTLTQTGLNIEPAWSPDGKKIAFASIESFNNLDIYTMNVDGTERINLTHNPGTERSPAWSLDGRQIAFKAYGRADMPNSAYMNEAAVNLDVFVMNADGSNPINLTQNGFYDLDPTWRP